MKSYKKTDVPSQRIFLALTGDFLNKNTSSTQRQNWRLMSHQTRIALAILNEPRDSFCREVI